ncbi:unnamed protein product [Callosobruchus maculatus]|nr:unnamed protein product [Callosobruchus maculatus]
MQMSEIVKADDDDHDVKLKIEMVKSDTDMNSVFDEKQLNEKLETKDEDEASSIDVAENVLREYVLQDGQGITDMSESTNSFSDYNNCKSSDYSKDMSLSYEQVDETKVTEHFHSSSDSETCLKNADLTPGRLSALNLHICTQCYTNHDTRELLNDHVIQNHPDLISSISGKVYECPNCTYKTSLSTNLTKHLLRKCEVTANKNFRACLHCNASFKTKKMLYDHLTKEHRDLTGTSTRYDCTRCTYKTIIKSKLDEHMLNKHTRLLESDVDKAHECPKCSYKFTAKLNLDNHILRKHSDLSAIVSSKIYECTKCTYKTTHRGCLFVHKLKHPETAHIGKLRCIHCSLSFNNDKGLDNHILKKHPNYASSIRSKIYECTKCAYKTTLKLNIDSHVLSQHPDLSATVSSKIHECTKCGYKTTNKSNLASHMLTHSETVDSHKCAHCCSNFHSIRSLDDHVVKRHPDFISSIGSKVHECTKCSYKTTIKAHFGNHILKNHPDLSETISSKIHKCTNCTYKTTNKSCFTAHILKHSETDNKHKCTQCSANFSTKRGLANHVLKVHQNFDSSVASKIHGCKHPDIKATVSSKIHVCKKCTYKTTNKSALAVHELKHP